MRMRSFTRRVSFDGFTMNSSAPSCWLACLTFSSLVVEYMMIMECCRCLSFLISGRHCIPSILGILISRKIKSGIKSLAFSFCSPSTPSWATLKPKLSSILCKAISNTSWSSISSSIKKNVCFLFKTSGLPFKLWC